MPVEVQLQNVVKLFDDVRAVDDVTLDIKKGELFFLLGPSGCGKTTCLRTVAGFYQPDSGNLYFDDRLMNDVPPHKRNTGMVFQNYALWPHMSVYENVEYGLAVRKQNKSERKERVEEVLEIVRMAEYAHRTANQLSGGQQQRIALARALVIKPDVLLLDEPLSNLDAKLRLEMRQEIKRIHLESSITAVYVTHDQEEALSLADRIAVMNNGKIVQVGSPREIYNYPNSRFVADFIGETNFINGRLTDIEGQLGTVESDIGSIQSININNKIAVGESTLCSIRPGSISVADSPTHVTLQSEPTKEGSDGTTFRDNINCFRAKVLNLTYLGNVEEYQLLVEDKLEIKAVLHNPSGDERHPGDAVYVTFAPKDVVLLAS